MVCSIDDYSDREWCDDLSSDAYFAKVLTWAGWRPERQEREWDRIRPAVSGKSLRAIDPRKVPYSLPWQRAWFTRLVGHLRSNRMTTKQLVDSLRRMNHMDAKRTLQRIVQTSEEKIVECWLRDVVKVPAFPIDGRVRDVLNRRHIREDSDLIVECAQELGIPVREFARAVYDNADKL